MLLSNHPHLVNKYDKSEVLRNKKEQDPRGSCSFMSDQFELTYHICQRPDWLNADMYNILFLKRKVRRRNNSRSGHQITTSWKRKLSEKITQ